ncbi:MAG: carbon-nitrogen family hydrolase, partial [Gammaproteobacteria bacterium]|nr:carbon-nitrogen family hydrolase [Gammaproteobacteria bacterium]
AVYRKVHLFGFSGGETTLMTAGEDLVVVDTPLGPTGLATCYDLRFPEMFRQLVDRGAHSFLVASGWPTRRIEHWRILARARAIENQAWVLACNQVGSHAGVVLGGHSMIVDPWGAVLASLPHGAGVVTANFDRDRLNKVRTSFPALDHTQLTCHRAPS